MDYIITNKTDNTHFAGLNGWVKLEENAIWYDKKEADEMCATLNDENLYVHEINQ